jgi:hypothetical protein
MIGALILATFGLSSIRDCGNGQGRAPLLGFDSQPTNPVAGDNVSLWVAYDLPAPAITGGTATYAFTLNGIPFAPTVDDLCTQTTCPKETGFNNETSSSLFPSGISGKVKSSITWKDQNDDLVWCVETTWRV